MIAHVWGMLVPVGEYAARTNLLSALFSAAGAGCFFLVVARVAGRQREPRGRLARPGRRRARSSAPSPSPTGRTRTRPRSTPSRPSPSRAMAWPAMLWRRRRGSPGAARLLLLVVYLAGISIGNHLLALLAGPAVVAFLAATLRAEPAADPAARRARVGPGRGRGGRLGAADRHGAREHRARHPGRAVLRGRRGLRGAAAGQGGSPPRVSSSPAVGVTPYLYLYLRAAQHPPINEAAPATFDALLAVIRRAQYPPRTPLDDPTVASGRGNPGRSLSLLAVQLGDYFVWFDWQWARSLGGLLGPLPVRTLVTLVFASLGLRGLLRAAAQDRAGWWLLLHALAGDRARARALHELPARLRAVVRCLARARAITRCASGTTSSS